MSEIGGLHEVDTNRLDEEFSEDTEDGCRRKERVLIREHFNATVTISYY
ncbi:MAG: hypothetical protein ACXACE_06175 [Candidatus Thorarchaeota archaeon]